MALTPQQKEFFSSLEQTFNTPGWGLLKQGWAEERDGLPTAAFFNVNDVEELRAFRVRYGLLDELVSLPETIAQQKLNAVEEAEDE
jgi:hypothetical protein